MKYVLIYSTVYKILHLKKYRFKKKTFCSKLKKLTNVCIRLGDSEAVWLRAYDNIIPLSGAGQKPKRVVEKRNTRERTRIGVINSTYHTLRRFFPPKKSGRRMSKLEILQRTINYIKDLREAVETEAPTSPTKLANADLPKRPRAKRSKAANLSDSKPCNQKRECSVDDNHNNQPSHLCPTTEATSPWQPQVEMLATENQENFTSCQYVNTNFLPPNACYPSSYSLPNAIIDQSAPVAHSDYDHSGPLSDNSYNHLSPLSDSSFNQSPSDSHSSMYFSSAPNATPDSHWPIDFAQNYDEQKYVYSNKAYSENFVNNFQSGNNFWGYLIGNLLNFYWYFLLHLSNIRHHYE